MKFSAATIIFSLLAVSTAVPHQVQKKDGKPFLCSTLLTYADHHLALSKPLPIVKRQVPVEVPSMKVGGVVVPFTGGGPKGGNNKREAQPVRRQVPVDVPSMKVGGVVVPFTGGGPNGKK